MTLSQYAASYVDAFGTPWAELVRGQGPYVWDTGGKRYIDLLGGIAVNSLGHANPAIVAAVSNQVAQLGHVSNFFCTPVQVELAERLRDLLASEGGRTGRVFLCNSGTEANEAALKIAYLRKAGSVVALTHGFHGRTLGALSVTHKPAIREPFPQIGDVSFVEPAVEAFESLSGEVSAIIVEPIQGEAGVVPVAPEVLVAARRAADRLDALLIVDEVQTGIGRCGRWFAHTEHVTADIVTLAKGLGGGLPIGAVIATGQAENVLTPGSHGTTFGGNPIAAAAALAVLGEVDRLLPQIRETSRWLVDTLARDGIHARGAGLLLGVPCEDAPSVVVAMRGQGVICQAPTTTTVRLAPPLIVTPQQLASPIADLSATIRRSRP